MVRIPEKRSEDPNDLANNILICNIEMKIALPILTSRRKHLKPIKGELIKNNSGELSVNNSPIKCAIIKTGFGQKVPSGKGREGEYEGQ